jgi:competence protein ComEA
VELPLPLTRRRALAGAILLVVALAVAGRFLSQAGAAAGGEPGLEVAALPAAEEPASLLVHVVGAVHAPGLYELPEGSRVADALARAGGATPKADLERVNLASPVADGTQVVVPREQAPGRAASPVGAGPASSGPVHLNSATAAELEALPGVGPVTAQKIVDHREKHGAFRSVDELLAVPGIGPKRVEALRDLAVP